MKMKRIMLALYAAAIFCGGYTISCTSAHASQDAAATTGPSFVELEPLVLPVLDEDGVSQIISLVVSFEVENELAVLEVQKLMPRLKDAFIQDMYGALGRDVAMEGGVLQVGAIKERLSKVSSKVLGDKIVKDVLLQVVQQRPV